jgi:hypothetical protein
VGGRVSGQHMEGRETQLLNEVQRSFCHTNIMVPVSRWAHSARCSNRQEADNACHDVLWKIIHSPPAHRPGCKDGVADKKGIGSDFGILQKVGRYNASSYCGQYPNLQGQLLSTD